MTEPFPEIQLPLPTILDLDIHNSLWYISTSSEWPPSWRGLEKGTQLVLILAASPFLLPSQSGGPSRGSGRHTPPATRHGAATGPWPRPAVASTTGRTTYELDISGFYQKCHGTEDPDLPYLVNWYKGDGNRENQVDLLCPSPVRLRGRARNVPLNSRVQRSGDWTLVPSAGPVKMMSSTPRWQWWRMFRKV